MPRQKHNGNQLYAKRKQRSQKHEKQFQLRQYRCVCLNFQGDHEDECIDFNKLKQSKAKNTDLASV